jgi:hypothetical protein
MAAVLTESRHSVVLAVEGLPDIPLFAVTDVMISPERVRILYNWQRRPDGKTQPVTIEVAGPRRLPNGELDRWRVLSRTHFTSEDRSEWPDWLAALVKEYTPGSSTA